MWRRRAGSHSYAAAEHIANGLLVMLEISDKQLREFRKGKVSQQGAVGRLLLEKHPHLGVSKSIEVLMKSAGWNAAMDYRGRLVHEQPPLVSGLGVVYRRGRSGWREGKNGALYLPIGGGDPPEFETSALIATCQGALAALVTVWDDSLHQFMEVLRVKGGIELKDGALHIPDYYRNKPGSPKPADSQDRPAQQQP
jgi:hypothetical protein